MKARLLLIALSVVMSMPYRFTINDSQIECDTAKEAVALAVALSAREDEPHERRQPIPKKPKPSKSTPLEKRKSPNEESVNERVERVVLFLNQEGPANSYHIKEALDSTFCRVQYALCRGPIVKVGSQYAANRISKLWDERDEAAFGKPQEYDGKAFGHEAICSARGHPPLSRPIGDDDPITKRISDSEAVELRAERILLFLNQEGPARMAAIADAANCGREVCIYAMKRVPVAHTEQEDGYPVYEAGRLSTLWNEDDEELFGHPKIRADGAVCEAEPSARDRKREANAACVVVGLTELGQQLEGALEAACPTT